MLIALKMSSIINNSNNGFYMKFVTKPVLSLNNIFLNHFNS